MPAKLSIPSPIVVNTQNTSLNYTSTTGGYLTGSDLHLNGNQIIIDVSKLYFVSLNASIEQNGSGVVNTATLHLFKNGVLMLESIKSYNENDENTMSITSYLSLSVGDVITASINFNTVPLNKIFVNSNPASTFLNIV